MPRSVSYSLRVLLLTLLSLAGAWTLWGGAMFNPGALNAVTGDTLGGVRSHAEIGRDCGSCHSTPADPRPMADHCLSCHGSVRRELADTTTLHGSFTGVACTACHGEHDGARAPLTRLDGVDGSGFDHDRTGFALDGGHTAVECRACHASAGKRMQFAGTPRACIACHRGDDVHAGELGSACAECHTAASWQGATFEHTFPLRHGSRTALACTVCHEQAPRTFDTYTCYGCHEHTPAGVRAEHLDEGIRDWQDCMKCHADGREHD